MEISIVIPAHNEGGNLPTLIAEIDKVLSSLNKESEIIVVDDNSTDNTLKTLVDLKNKYSALKFIRREENQGVGNTFREGFKHTRGDFIITMDADLSHDPSDIPKLYRKIKDGCDMVIGSRYIKEGGADMTISRVLISRSFNIIFGNLLGLKISDFTSGFRIYKKEGIKTLNLESSGFGIYVEIPIKAFLSGFTIKEIPIQYHSRQSGSSKLSYIKQGPEYLKVAFNGVHYKFFGGSAVKKKEFKKLRDIYYTFPPEIDSKAQKSNIRVQKKWHEEKREVLPKHIDFKDKSVLDVGCGSGGITFSLAGRAKKVVGLDFNERAILYAENRKKETGNRQIHFLSGAIENLPFNDESFHVIICLDVLDHSLKSNEALTEIYRVLAPGGKTIITVENRRSLWPIVEHLWDRFGASRNYNQTHVTRFDKKKLELSIKKAGFDIESIYTIHNASTFFYLISDWYPKGLDNLLKKNCLGLTLLCSAIKP